MIVLLEPVRPEGFVSGGYRYHDEVMRRLSAHGRGRRLAVEPALLRAAVERLRGEPDATIVVDGLFARTGEPLPAGVTALLHMVPALETWADEPLAVIATAEATGAHVMRSARSVAIVRPGLDRCFVPPATPPRNAVIRVLCVGTVCAGKGQLLVARALASAAPGRCELVLVGDPTSEPHYVDAVRSFAARVPMRWTGCLPAPDVARELQGADLFVSASRRESFGMAVAEAVACGLPLLAFDTGEIRAFAPRSARLLPVDADDAVFEEELAQMLAALDVLPRTRSEHAVRPADDWDTVARAFERACTGPERERTG